MRTLFLFMLAGMFLLGACDSAQDITAPVEPEMIEPSFHIITPGYPDGSYSMYYFDLDLRNNLVLKLGQAWALNPLNPTATRCQDIASDHNSDYTGGPPSPSDLAPATGIGSFMIRNGWRKTRGLLIVKGACWFDEWNEKGFPESAWAYGNAWVGLRRMDFWVKLESRGFPEIEHIINKELDLGVLYLGNSTVPVLSLDGELHHEDGLTLIG